MLAGLIGLDAGLVIHIDNLGNRGTKAASEEYPGLVHPDRIQQIELEREVSPIPRDLMEDQRLDQVIDSAERAINDSIRARDTSQRNRVNPLTQTTCQLKKARKTKRLQETGNKRATERNQRLKEIRGKVIQNLGKE
jgi:hypothetical protein